MRIFIRPRSFFLVVAVAAASASVLLPGAASACGGALADESYVRHRRDLPLAALQRTPGQARPDEEIAADLMAAQARLDAGEYHAARSLVLKAVPDVMEYDARYARPRVARALRTLALATLRARGSGDDAMVFALATLRGLAARDAGDAVARTDLGEALSRFPWHEDEAREILESLAKEDLLVHARGFAALARQRASAGASAAAEEALDRCHAMASVPQSSATGDCEIDLASLRPSG